mmetsp:Transcript_10160/g.37201  ORF Transcript_10160/g.37201 Transcript_10160/m.37201 type:complete len:222 (-) Transcript_10160:576-1241(-)
MQSRNFHRSSLPQFRLDHQVQELPHSLRYSQRSSPSSKYSTGHRNTLLRLKNCHTGCRPDHSAHRNLAQRLEQHRWSCNRNSSPHILCRFPHTNNPPLYCYRTGCRTKHPGNCQHTLMYSRCSSPRWWCRIHHSSRSHHHSLPKARSCSRMSHRWLQRKAYLAHRHISQCSPGSSLDSRYSISRNSRFRLECQRKSRHNLRPMEKGSPQTHSHCHPDSHMH